MTIKIGNIQDRKPRNIIGRITDILGKGIINEDFEDSPGTTVTTTAERWIDGTVGGSTTNDTYGWFYYSYGGLTGLAGFDDTVYHGGLYSLKLISSDTTAGPWYRAVSHHGFNFNKIKYLIPISPGITLTTGVWYKTDSISNINGGGLRFWFQELNANLVNTRILTQWTPTTTTGTVDWTYKSQTCTTQTGTAYCTVHFEIYQESGTLWIDDVFVSPVITGTYNNSKINMEVIDL